MNLPHKIERTRNRNSRAVMNDDMIVIRLARGLTQREEQRHIDVLLGRMAKAFGKMKSRTLVDPFRPMLTGDTSVEFAVATGASYIFHAEPSLRLWAKRSGPHRWWVGIPAHAPQKAVHRFLWKVLAADQSGAVTRLVHEVNEQTVRASVASVRLRIASSKWGSCSPTAGIMLNAALLFVPVDVLRYVIIHELAHVHHPDHSRRFWATVDAAMPGFEESYKKLKQYRLPRF